MTDTRVVEALRESIRQAGGLEPYLNPADDIECRLASSSASRQPRSIDAASLILTDQLKEVGKMMRPVLEAGESLVDALTKGDDKRCRDLPQEVADHLLASGYKPMRPSKMRSKPGQAFWAARR
jgi:hypothetical protein